MLGVRTIEHSVRERLNGDRPSRTRASVSAAVTGTAVAVGVYKALRGG
jgi:hypothetical protein